MNNWHCRDCGHVGTREDFERPAEFGNDIECPKCGSEWVAPMSRSSRVVFALFALAAVAALAWLAIEGHLGSGGSFR